MATIIDQVTLRTGVADWLNRSDLTDAQIDDFVAIGEARIYEDLRVPTLEISQGFSVTATNSSIIVPEGFLEMIELKNHTWYVGCQFHPEFTSSPIKGHPLFNGFVRAASKGSK